ncbi:MAG: tetratricopeptide repeat protein [Nibricoccus sp.]
MPETTPKPTAFQPLGSLSPSIQSWLLGLVLAAMVVLAYQPAWTAGFIWDDDDYVTNNPLLSAPDGLWRIWFSTDSPSQYFPLTYSSFRLQYSLWQLNPAGYHWVNILLHAVNALLVWRLLARLSLPGAWFGAAVFALHPLQVESVAWITELKNVQSLFFFLLALLAWLEWAERPKPWRWYALALLFHALALLSKTTACTLPAALVLILWLKHKPIDLRRWLQIAPFVLLSLAMGLLTVWWERHHQGTGAVAFSYNALDRLLIASRSLCFYLGKFLWPVDLTFSYPLWKIDAASLLAYAWLILLLALTAVLFLLRKQFGRGPGTALVWFASMLSPLLGFIMLYTFKYTFVADHYVYVALLGPAALLAAGLHSLRLPALRLGLSAVILLACAGATFRQSHMYKNLQSLWQTTIEKNPASHIAHNNLSAALLAKGHADEALRHAQEALALDPPQSDRALSHINQGNALLQLGRVDESIFQLQKAVETQPDLADAHNNLGSALRRKGDLDAAMHCFQKAIALAPAHANAHYNLGNAYFDKGAFDEAIREYQASLASNPTDPDIHTNLASACLRQQRLGEAVVHFQHALELAPTNIQSHSNLAYALLQTGRPDEAATVLERALKLLEKQPDLSLKETLQAQLAACREHRS